jgi:hypothetical protein
MADWDARSQFEMGITFNLYATSVSNLDVSIERAFLEISHVASYRALGLAQTSVKGDFSGYFLTPSSCCLAKEFAVHSAHHVQRVPDSPEPYLSCLGKED